MGGPPAYPHDPAAGTAPRPPAPHAGDGAREDAHGYVETWDGEDYGYALDMTQHAPMRVEEGRGGLVGGGMDGVEMSEGELRAAEEEWRHMMHVRDVTIKQQEEQQIQKYAKYQFSISNTAWIEYVERLEFDITLDGKFREWLPIHIDEMLNTFDVFYRVTSRFEDLARSPRGKAVWYLHFEAIGLHRMRKWERESEAKMHERIRSMFTRDVHVEAWSEEVLGGTHAYNTPKPPPPQTDGVDDPFDHLSFWERFKLYWWVVPQVQWEGWALMYQMYTFFIFHQSFRSKMVHFYTIPTNVMLTCAFLAQWEWMGVAPFSLNAGFVLIAALFVWYLQWGKRRNVEWWGLFMAPVLLACYVVGNMWYHTTKRDGNPWYNPTSLPANPLIWIYVTSFVQAASHGFNDTQPGYITGQTHWESMEWFMAPQNRKWLALACLAFPTLFVIVAYVSFPHLIGTAVLRVAFALGYKPEVWEPFNRTLEKAVATGNPEMDFFPKYGKDLEERLAADQWRGGPVMQ